MTEPARETDPVARLNRALVNLADQTTKDVTLCVTRGPIAPLTAVQVTQLRVVLGMALREAAARGRWCEKKKAAIQEARALVPKAKTVHPVGWDDEITEVMDREARQRR